MSTRGIFLPLESGPNVLRRLALQSLHNQLAKEGSVRNDLESERAVINHLQRDWGIKACVYGGGGQMDYQAYTRQGAASLDTRS